MQMTARELFDLGKWGEYCDLTDKNVWAVNEGIIDEDDLLPITVAQAREIGILKAREDIE